jgi:hypothetical protein
MRNVRTTQQSGALEETFGNGKSRMISFVLLLTSNCKQYKTVKPGRKNARVSSFFPRCQNKWLNVE